MWVFREPCLFSYLCIRLTINRIHSRANMGLIALGLDSNNPRFARAITKIKTVVQLNPNCPTPYAIISTNYDACRHV